MTFERACALADVPTDEALAVTVGDYDVAIARDGDEVFALQDQAHTIFFGNLVVPPGAPGTDAYQTNRNLVLNEGARADTIPFLEIETAEVKCSHAGAVGRVDDEHLFYLRSRGVPEHVAKRLIVLGFFQEVLAQVTLEELRTELEHAVEAKLAV